MSTINDGDKLLVNRNDTSYQLEAKNSMAEIQDNDLLLVNRGGTSYKINGADIKQSLDPQRSPQIGSVVLTEDDTTGYRFTDQDFTTTVGLNDQGEPIAGTSIKATLSANIVSKLETDTITSVTSILGSWRKAPAQPNGRQYIKSVYCPDSGIYVGISYFGVSGNLNNDFDLVTSTDNLNWTLLTTPATDPDGVGWMTIKRNPDIVRNPNTGRISIVIPCSDTGSPYKSRVLYTDDDGANWSFGKLDGQYEGSTMFGGGQGMWYIPEYDCILLAPDDVNGTGSVPYKSTDGINFNKLTSSSQAFNELKSCYTKNAIYADGKFVVVGEASNISPNRSLFYTADGGTTWTSVAVGGSNVNAYTIAYGAGVWCVINRGNTSKLYFNTDGTLGNWADNPSWDRSAKPSDSRVSGHYPLFYINNRFISLSTNTETEHNVAVDPGLGWVTLPEADAGLIQDLTFSAEATTSNQTNGMISVLESNTGDRYYTYTSTTGDLINLTFSGDKDLEQFTSGDAVSQSNGTAYGTVAESSKEGKSLSLSNASGNWTAGLTVKGPGAPLITDNISNVQSEVGDWVGTPCQYRNMRWDGICFGEDPDNTELPPGGRFVCVASDNHGSENVDQRDRKVAYSDDGINWTQVSVPTPTDFKCKKVVYGKGCFVAVGPGAFWRSTDGINWTKTSNAMGYSSQAWWRVVYGEWCGRFVATAENTAGAPYQVCYSEDGIEWKWISNADGYPSNSGDYPILIAGNDRFVLATINNGNVWVSFDGYTWSGYGGGIPSNYWRFGTFGNGVFYAVGSSRTAYSYDGTIWFEGNGQMDSWTSCGFGAGKFLAYCFTLSNKYFAYSYNGITNIRQDSTSIKEFQIQDFAYGLGKMVGVGGNSTTDNFTYSITSGSPGSRVTFTGNKDLNLFQVGDSASDVTGAVKGTVGDINVGGNTMLIDGAPPADWPSGQPVFGPKGRKVDTISLYPILTTDLTVTDLSSTDTGFVPFTGPTPKIHFPVVLADGQAPDTTLLAGTTLTTTVQANNNVGAPSTMSSNTVTPGTTRVNGFDKNVPADVAQFDLLKDSFYTYENERDTRRSSLKSAMVAANFTAEEIATAGLDDA